MKHKTIYKPSSLGPSCISHILLLFALFAPIIFTGCGKKATDNEAGNEMVSDSSNEARKTESASGKDIGNWVYIEQREIEDTEDGKSVYEIYMPKESEINDGYAFFNEHGLYYSASVYDYGGADSCYEIFQHTCEDSLEYYRDPDLDYTELLCSGLKKNGDDLYYLYAYRGIDYYGDLVETRQLSYLEMQPTGNGIIWHLTTDMTDTDEEASLIIEEMAQCYGIELDLIKPENEWSEESDQDTYEVKEGHNTLKDLDGYQYMGLTSLSDIYGHIECEAMIPKARQTNVKDSHAYSFLHGVQVSADVEEVYVDSTILVEMKYHTDSRYEERVGNTERIRNVWKSSMMPVPDFEDALLTVMTYEKRGLWSEEYLPRVEALLYINLDDTYYLEVDFYLTYEKYDDSTNAIIQELETAYGIELGKYFDNFQESGTDNIGLENASGDEISETASNNEKSEAVSNDENQEIVSVTEGQESNNTWDGELITMAKLIGGGEEVSVEAPLPETILWFNATYAPLTYSNGCNWHLVGGLKPTEKNQEITSSGLKSSWSVTDRESALETVARLREKGHRQTCQKCIEELAEMGLLELDEKEFKKQYLQTDFEDKSYRYVLAYYLYQSGQGADYIAAWDLCRANQLYADFYICGYMTYEEAMDASLENSLILQKMYSSWEEMIDGYMMGYQFWQSDPATRDDSPTKERYHYYEMLRDSDDSPYTLNWNMELKKSW